MALHFAGMARPQAARISTVRIIGGAWKRTPLKVPGASDVRPTPDRVRETVFNWLTHQFGGSLNGLHVLDLFAGSGALGFEAASRGAARVVLVDSNTAAATELRAAKAKLKADAIEIVQGDAFNTAQFLGRVASSRAPVGIGAEVASTAIPFDIVFLDPPYHKAMIEQMFRLLPQLLSDRGLVYAEAESRLEETMLAESNFEILRADKAGRVFYHLLRPKQQTHTNANEGVPC